jgi:anti-sigma-K factor RskA
MYPNNKDKPYPIATHQVKNYLTGKLSIEESRYVEEKMTDDAAWGDAIEGLKLLEQEVSASKVEQELHLYLKKRLGKSRKNRLKSIQFPLWLILAVAVILMSLVAAVALLQWI